MDTVAEHYEVKVVKIKIQVHPHADTLEIAKIGGYNCVIKKGYYNEVDLYVYVPEHSIIEKDLVEKLIEEKVLPVDSKSPFHVKPIKLRGILSQGILLKADPEWKEGQDVKDILSIKKWEAPISSIPFFKGKVVGFNAGSTRCMNYDIENIKKYPNVIEEGELVTFAEKVHGTWSQVGFMSNNNKHQVHGSIIISSKGLASKGTAFLIDDQSKKDNLYVKTAFSFKIPEKLQSYFQIELENGESVFMLGEIFGEGVQDLGYGNLKGMNGYRVFDIYIGNPNQGRYLGDEELSKACEEMELDRVPVLYRGPFSSQLLEKYTMGKETISGKSLHIREGIVVRPLTEKYHPKLGRVQLKSISEDYLLRKNGTEFN